ADVGAVFNGVLLKLTVDDFVHPLDQESLFVALQERVPIAAPKHFDDVPACPAKDRLELLNDLGVAPDRTVEPLKVAVDHPNQVVELLPRSKTDRSHRLGLVRL